MLYTLLSFHSDSTSISILRNNIARYKAINVTSSFLIGLLGLSRWLELYETRNAYVVVHRSQEAGKPRKRSLELYSYITSFWTNNMMIPSAPGRKPRVFAIAIPRKRKLNTLLLLWFFLKRDYNDVLCCEYPHRTCQAFHTYIHKVR